MSIECRYSQCPRSSFESRLPALGLSESRCIGDLSGRSAMYIYYYYIYFERNIPEPDIYEP